MVASVMALRKMTPGGYEYLTGSVACADHELQPGENLADYYLAHGYPPGHWIGAGAAELGVIGEVTEAHMLALFGEGRHPRADEIMAERIAAGDSPQAALKATKLGRRFPQYGGEDALRRHVNDAYKQHNRAHNRRPDAPLDDATRQQIRDQVQRQAFAEAHDGRCPIDTAELQEWLAEGKRAMRNATAGYELVFAPDKATSVAWALSDPATSEWIAEAHRQAVLDAVALFEREVAFTRAGNYGEAQADTRGITAAVFEHWDSRTGDPHLHTHVPISVKVQRYDGQWTSLDGRTVHAAAVTISEFYNSRLRDLLREQGATFVQRPADGIDLKRPVWELEGIPAALVRAWSQRTQQVEQDRARRIVAFRNEHGREPTAKELIELGRRAQYGTRSAKGLPQTLSEHRARWREFADSVIGHKEWGARIFTAKRAHDTYDIGALAMQTRQAVSEHHATFNRWNLLAEAHRQTAGLHLSPQQREQVVTDIVESIVRAHDTVHLQAPSMVTEPEALRRGSGESVFVEHNSSRYTSTETLRAEQELVNFARRHDGHKLATDTVAAALAASAARGTKLNEAQARMVTEFGASGRRVQLALAPAGTGKTTAMRVFADAWRADGGRVYAFGPSARAAQELADSIGAKPHTLHQIPEALRRGTAEKRFPFRRGDVLIVDEAAMSGTHTLHTVVDYALRRGADVRLIGDDRQLTAVEAGGAIRLLAHEVGAIRLREVVRFTDRQQAAASLQIREGNTAGIDYYRDQGWIHSGSIETMRDAAQRAWQADLDAGRESLLIVPRNDDVIALNLQAHEHRVAHGEVDTSTTVTLHDGTQAGRGDWIVTRRNDRTLTVFAGQDFVKNGETWFVHSIQADGSLRVQHRRHHGSTVLPVDYVRGEVELAYATTINRTQGMNVRDSAHTVVTPETTREQLYPGITRSAHENRMYVVTSRHVADDHQKTPPEQEPEAVLAGVLAPSGAELSATEALRESLANEESLSTLVLRHDYAANLATQQRHKELLQRVAPDAADADAAPALLQTLRNAEDAGWQAERLLPKVVAQGNLDDARDVAAVLVYRIERYTAEHEPPARIAEPADGDIQRWQSLVTAASGTPGDGPGWNVVWRHAAGGAQQGLDADMALAHAAKQLSGTVEPTALACGLVAYVAKQQDIRTDQAALPWLVQHHRAAVSPDRQLDQYLQQMNTAIAHRTEELRDQVARELPEWASQLGPRPAEPHAAAAWDQAAALSAAYRETYRITDDNADQPIGQRPNGNGLQARAWDTVTEHWRTAVTTPEEDAYARSEQRLNDIRDELQGTLDNFRDDNTIRQGHHDETDQRDEELIRVEEVASPERIGGDLGYRHG